VSSRRSLGMLLVAGVCAAGCGSGLHSETDKERATPFVANASLGDIGVRAARVILVSDTTSTTGSSSAPQAYLSATLVNASDTADTLTSATVGGGAVQASGGPAVTITVPAQQVVTLGEPDLGLTGPALSVGALATPLQAGTTTTVTFTFQNAGTTTVLVPVINSDEAGTTASAAPVTATG
jgi:copper(I)-binding protein